MCDCLNSYASLFSSFDESDRISYINDIESGRVPAFNDTSFIDHIHEFIPSSFKMKDIELRVGYAPGSYLMTMPTPPYRYQINQLHSSSIIDYMKNNGMLYPTPEYITHDDNTRMYVDTAGVIHLANVDESVFL